MIFLKLFIFAMNFAYCFFKLLPVRDKVVMISRQSNKVNSDFELLGKALRKHKIVYLCKTLDDGANSTTASKIRYGFHMFRQMFHLATSKVCILDSYCPTVSILKHKKKLTVVQIWHSVGTMKSFGYHVIDREEGTDLKLAETMHMHQNYTFACGSSEETIKTLALGFNLPLEKMKVFTLPRIDLLKDPEYEKDVKSRIFSNYPQLKEKKNIVYAPTFRKDESAFEDKLNKLLEYIDFDRYNFIVKLHPLSKTVISNDKVLVDRNYSTFDMIFIADKFISDYSCVIYEAGIRNVPLYFYNYDMDNYADIRGFDLDYTTLPGYTEPRPEELVKDLESEYDYDYLKAFIHKYVDNTDSCTEKLAFEIEKYMN
ncbi:MAG: CDP-glycerol glycerophosphotransferase family protein [Clostridiales bacterium]|nr:CDP-glycerol glycerophosphotransferase family protein [Clostridiales bacterium]